MLQVTKDDSDSDNELMVEEAELVPYQHDDAMPVASSGAAGSMR